MSSEFQFGSSIPVLRMLDEDKMKSFYCNFLGFSIDWEHRFNDSPESPLYLQAHLGDAVVHLNGHAGESDPVTEVRIPVRELEAYCEHLRSKATEGDQPETVDPRYTGKKEDMNILDPSGNHLVFWLQEEG